MSNLINIRTFLKRYEVELVKGLLAEQGIESIIPVDDCGGYRPHLPLGMGGIQLLVKKEDAEKAKEILKTLDSNSNSPTSNNSPSSSKSSFLPGIILGILLGVTLAVLFSTGMKNRYDYPTEWDMNGDGNIDVWAKYSMASLSNIYMIRTLRGRLIFGAITKKER